VVESKFSTPTDNKQSNLFPKDDIEVEDMD